MNFSLLNPFFLIGLAAVALPVIAHFISKKSGTRTSFPSLRFLIASRGEAARRSKIKDLLLLLVRASVLVLLVIVFSKPAVFSFSNADVRDAKSVAIIVDNSFSMGYRDNFQTAKDRAEDLIKSLPDGSFGFVVPLVSTDDARPAVTGGRGKMMEDLDSLKLSYHFADNETRLEEIFGYLKNTPNEKKEVILFTDMQRNGWRTDDVQKRWLSLIDVTEDGETENRSVSQTEVKDAGDSLKVSIKVSNHSKAPVKNLLAAVSLDDEKTNGFFDIGAEGKETEEFIFSAGADSDEFVGGLSSGSGEIRGKVEISHDNLETDDVRHFVFSGREKPQVLIVDGDRREDARLSESYYLARAVETIYETAPLALSIKDNDAFLSEELEKYDLIMLANVGDCTPQKAAEIEEFLKRGGSLVIFLGDRARTSVYNGLLGNILPAEIGVVAEGDYSLSADGSSALTEGMGERLKEVKVNRLFALRAAENSGTILTASNNFPFLIQKEFAKGRVFLFASTADARWNNFPVTPVFLPTVKRIIDISLRPESEKKNFLVGEPVEIVFSGQADEAAVENPSGEEFNVSAENPKFRRTYIPGVYTVKERANTVYSFSVNVDPKESNLEKISLKSNPDDPVAKGGLVKVFKEVWSYFLWGAVALFIAESVLRMKKS